MFMFQVFGLLRSRVQFFIWLLAKNKVLTRDNLTKKQR
jgi:hypothetical protein